MGYTSSKIKDIVTQSVNHSWSIPEFQRGFVWKQSQVKDLIESLWLNYPIGSILVWLNETPVEERIVTDAQHPTQWVVDGQQRAAALCILFGRKPYWWSSAEEWEKTIRRYDIRYDVEAKETPFLVANAAIKKVKGNRYIPVSALLNLDPEKEKDDEKLLEKSSEIKKEDLCKGMEAIQIYTRLDRVRKIRDKEIVTITIDQELEDVVEIFSRLNSKGTRVTEADIYLGIVAARTPGWVREFFLPYLKKLSSSGFNLNPNLLFRTITSVGIKKVRFKEIPKDFWNNEKIAPAWSKTTGAWEDLIKRFQTYGILSNDILPTEAALVTLITLLEKFPNCRFEWALYWFLQASRFSRYSGSSTTHLGEDLKDVSEAIGDADAIKKLLARISIGSTVVTADDFYRDYSDGRFGRLLLYLLIYRNKAEDWDSKGHQIGFDGKEILAGFKPQWHHTFPQKYLENKVPQEKIDALANIAVIGPSINIRISNKSPMNYIEKYKITSEKLRQQFIEDDIGSITESDYEKWLAKRADRLTEAANKFMDELKKDLDNG